MKRSIIEMMILLNLLLTTFIFIDLKVATRLSSLDRFVGVFLASIIFGYILGSELIAPLIGLYIAKKKSLPRSKAESGKEC